jgi:hypothetical protein
MKRIFPFLVATWPLPRGMSRAQVEAVLVTK